MGDREALTALSQRAVISDLIYEVPLVTELVSNSSHELLWYSDLETFRIDITVIRLRSDKSNMQGMDPCIIYT